MGKLGNGEIGKIGKLENVKIGEVDKTWKLKIKCCLCGLQIS